MQRLAVKRVEERVVGALARAGFPLMKKDVLYEKAIGRVICPEDELIFNRGLDGKSSNFCVFAKLEKDGAVVLHHYNPDPNGVMLRRDEFIRKTVLLPCASDREINEAVRQISLDATKKRPNQFFFSPHNHFGALSPPYAEKGKTVRHPMVKFDDGVSFLTDNIRKALFYGIDYYALSTHNSFSKRVFDFMNWAGHALSLTPIPSIELTLPLKEPNGPHVLVWMKDAKVAAKVRRSILEKGIHLDMPSFFTGMPFERVLEILFEYQKNDMLALGLAHPINFNSPSLPIPIVGLFTAVDTEAETRDGIFDLERAEELAGRFDSVAMWNASLYKKAREVPIGNEELKAYLRDINRRRVGNRKLWVDQTNYALAEELHEKYGVYTHFETDEHKTLPFVESADGGYAIGGDSLGMGMTVLEVPETRVNWARPNASEIIDMIRKKVVDMHGVVFAVKRADGITIHAERSVVPDELKHARRRYDDLGLLRYTGMLVKDLFGFIFRGEGERIEHMPGD